MVAYRCDRCKKLSDSAAELWQIKGFISISFKNYDGGWITHHLCDSCCDELRIEKTSARAQQNDIGVRLIEILEEIARAAQES